MILTAVLAVALLLFDVVAPFVQSSREVIGSRSRVYPEGRQAEKEANEEPNSKQFDLRRSTEHNTGAVFDLLVARSNVVAPRCIPVVVAVARRLRWIVAGLLDGCATDRIIQLEEYLPGKLDVPAGSVRVHVAVGNQNLVPVFQRRKGGDLVGKRIGYPVLHQITRRWDMQDRVVAIEGSMIDGQSTGGFVAEGYMGARDFPLFVLFDEGPDSVAQKVARCVAVATHRRTMDWSFKDYNVEVGVISFSPVLFLLFECIYHEISLL
eukprot:CAMPEP_0197182088 /NCGR_PEP_ID=MMETSP1423-20130617/6169_1 /TAXON_ID=476441 /ORGANISM="Pseudo-nitzschia heimii, Strain UNC1101" /LENGTH=264 /DNA_ID=CAMNT_0042632459 /DNA_START=322 /DNA_END=1117 /DNA_ORIENTATION=-